VTRRTRSRRNACSGSRSWTGRHHIASTSGASSNGGASARPPTSSGSNCSRGSCSSAIRPLPATRPGTVRMLSVTTWTRGSMRSWRSGQVARVARPLHVCGDATSVRTVAATELCPSHPLGLMAQDTKSDW
jgi:hypothetical protein